MSGIQRAPKWDYKKTRMSKKARRRDRTAILDAYEKAMAKGQSRDDILQKLAQRYDRSERQIERYIQQAREENEVEQSSPPTATDDKPQAMTLHFEAISQGINLWMQKQTPPSAEELRGMWKGKLEGWGVVAEVTHDGHGSAGPAMGPHPLCDSFRHHLVPPVVQADFWAKVDESISLGLSFLSGAASLRRELSKDAEQRTGFGTVAGSWQDEPATGITQDFVRTLCEQALTIADFGVWTHSIWAALWPVTGGLIVTWANEGARLLRGLGYEPSIPEVYWPLTGGVFMLPRHPRERIAYGDARLDSPVGVAFLLCFGTTVIATALASEELALPAAVHRTMLAEYGSAQKASSLRSVRARLESLSQEVRTSLEFASCETSFPVRCDQCP